MGTAQEALKLAASFLGFKEGPRNNETPFGAYTGYNFQPWCGSYVKYCLDKTGTVGEPSPVYTPSGVIGYKNAGRWVERNAPAYPGDVVFFDWGGTTSAAMTDHVGFVEKVLPDGRLQTLEGNTSYSNQSNGGEVQRRIRDRGSVVGFGRPRYSSPAPPTPIQEDDDMSRLIETPGGTIWLCTGAWRTKVTSEDAKALQFIGTPRQKVDQSFAEIIERTLADTAWCSTAAWYSKFGPVKS
jgi:hypothetical protein